MTKIRFIVLTFLIVSIAMIGNSMTDTANANNSKDDIELEPGVSHALAKSRAANYSDIRYSLNLQILPGAERMVGSEQIHLKVKDISTPVIIDWRVASRNNQAQGSVKNIVVNDKPAALHPQIQEH